MRNTVQREEILSFLRSKRAHYNAVQVYDAVREKIPNISLGTVYRNLGKLIECGDIISVETEDICVYYDGFIKPHAHFVCRCCSEIYDFEISDDNFEDIESLGFKVENTRTVYYGICNKCIK
ncbi:MAG: transcriptional repressor [Clostridia bacterium]|nr:transcriptional repressor [Clostridia bacterium]